MSKPYANLVPSVERRLSAWISISRTRTAGGPRVPRPTITISRRFGCEAFPLCEQLKALLDEQTGESWTIFDKALIERVSQDEQLSMAVLEDLGGPSRAVDRIGYLVPGYQTQPEIFRHIPKYIVKIAEEGGAIIVGRGAAVVTHDLPNCYHFRLEAPFEFRVASMARRLEISEADAQRLVREGEKTREQFVEECLHASLSDTTWYDGVFNNARHGVTDIARAIAAYVQPARDTRPSPRP
jgi:cytidylate kinase